MHRRDVLMTIIGAAEGRSFSPVQLQKAAFLIDRNLPELFDRDSRFNFAPYDYGPFDQAVYAEADALNLGRLIQSGTGSNGYRQYSATDEGVSLASQKLNELNERQKSYIVSVVNWVRSLGFAQLVKSIYEEYPEMKLNSIFVG